MPLVYRLAIHMAARADLDAIGDSDPESAGVLEATMEQIGKDQRLLESLTIKEFGAHGTEAFHVDRWSEQQRQGRNLWRLKVWELEHQRRPYRVVYALDPRATRYCILGIFTRDFNYDRRDPRTQRVLADYDKLSIPTYR